MPVQAMITRPRATADAASGATQGGRGGGGLATRTAGRTTEVAGFGIAILSSRAFARMRFSPSRASLARASSAAAGDAALLLVPGFPDCAELSFGSRACFAAPEKSAVSLGRDLPSDNIQMLRLDSIHRVRLVAEACLNPAPRHMPLRRKPRLRAIPVGHESHTRVARTCAE